MANLFKSLGNLQLFRQCLKQSAGVTTTYNRNASKTRNPNPPPRKRHPEWLPKISRVLYEENLTRENKEFIQEVIQDKYPNNFYPDPNSPLKFGAIEPNVKWTKQSRRTGVIGKKIGVYPMWLKNGKKISTTLLQVLDNHVIKYIPPDEWYPVIGPKKPQIKRRLGCLIVGADSADPQLFTKEYSALFANAGVMPKRVLLRFPISPDAALQPGTPLYATHFRPGDVIDVRGKTIDRGFQGVMKRWGFKGMPASHGVTKTHRRGGNIGSGGGKARVMPGTKMPGHMGNRWRMLRGVKVLRVNTKYNVLWVLGQNLPGEIGTFCYLYDTLLPLRKPDTPPHFPTYLPQPDGEPLPEELFLEELHTFREPTIMYEETEKTKK